MNILVVSDAFWPDDTGGISKSLLLEVQALVSRGHRVVVVTRRIRKGLAPYEVREGYELCRYLSPTKESVFYRTYPIFSILALRQLLKDMRWRFDIVYVHNPFQMLGLLLAHLDVPLIYTFHAPMIKEVTIDARAGKYGFLSRIVKMIGPVIKMVEEQALRNASLILVRSEYMKRELASIYKSVNIKKVLTVPLGIDTERFEFVSDPRVVRDKLDLPKDRKVLLTVRRLVARMGLQNLLNAMKLVVTKHPEVLLVIGGKGYLENVLRKYIRSQGLEAYVKLVGFIPEEKLPLYYQAADLFILPTAELEGFGLVTLEALSCGTPVIATPVGANPEVVGPLSEEFLCEDNTAEAMAERIDWWLNRGVTAEIRQRCREYCVLRFDIKSIAFLLENIFVEARNKLQ
ncbi:MAG: glycosyltransferase family 4 protein [Candidatus Bathyarchaeia archaeon]